MSRSYHITRKSAARRKKEGDGTAIHELSEKKAVKESVARYRKNYPLTRPSAKPRVLKNSFVVASVKKVLAPRSERSE